MEELWRRRQDLLADKNHTNTAATATDYHMRLDARLGYGFALRDYAGVLTHYSEMTLGNSDQYRIGMHGPAGASYHLNLLCQRDVSGSHPSTPVSS